MDEIESPLLPHHSKGAEVKAKDYSKRTPLHIAVEKEDLEAIRTLISSEPHQINAVDVRGRTALHYASELGKIECMRTLLDEQFNPKADPNQEDDKKLTAILLLGIRYLTRKFRSKPGYDDGAQILIQGGANVNVKDPYTGMTPLHQAVMMGNLEATTLLLDAGADPSATDSEGRTILHACALKGHARLLKLLMANQSVKEYVNVGDLEGERPIHNAAHRGCPECIQLLHKDGADLGAKTNTGMSATTLILQLPRGANILSERLDQSIVTYGTDRNKDTFRMGFNYSTLLRQHKPENGTMKENQMEVIKDILKERQYPTADVGILEERKKEAIDLLQHPIVESFLVLKWRKVQNVFFFNLFLYLTLVVSVSIYLLSSTSTSPATTANLNETNGGPKDNQAVSQPVNDPDMNLQLLLFIIIPFMFFQEVFQMISFRARYFCEGESFIKLGALISSAILICSPPPWSMCVHLVSAVSVLFGWIEITFLVGRLPMFGDYGLIFYSVTSSVEHFFKLILASVFILTGISILTVRFLFMFQGKPSHFYIFAKMVGGNTDFGDEYTASDVQLIYSIIFALASMVLINLFFGLAVNGIQGLPIPELRIKRLRKQAEFIIYLEDMTTNPFLLRLLYSDGLKKRWNSWLKLDKLEFNFFAYDGRERKSPPPRSTSKNAREKKRIKAPFSPRIVERAEAIVNARK